jgi:hypothetical protein
LISVAVQLAPFANQPEVLKIAPNARTLRVRKVNRSIVTSPELLAKPLKRQVDWPVNVAFTGSNLCTRANQLSPLNISTARAEDWPVNAVIQG